MLPKSFAIISGDNGLNGNARIANPSTSKLARDVSLAEYEYQEVIGKYLGKLDNALIIENIPYYAALSLAKKYGQESFIFTDNENTFLVFTDNERALLATGIKILIDPKDDYTLVPGVGYFSYDFNRETIPTKVNVNA